MNLQAIKYDDLKRRRLALGTKSIRDCSIAQEVYRLSQVGVERSLWDYYLSIHDVMR